MNAERLDCCWNIDDAKELMPSAKDRGSYVLFVHLDKDIVVKRPASYRLRRGTYGYAGSARNGILSRIQWHLKEDKRVIWHVDQLTMQGRIQGVMWSKRLSECDLANMLREKGWTEPMKGFGASDCENNCFSHLFYQEALRNTQSSFHYHAYPNFFKNR